MNISFRSLWNNALGAWVAVSEIASARGKPQRARRSGATAGAVHLAGVPFRLNGLMAVIVMAMAGGGLAAPTWAQNLVIGTVGSGGNGVNGGGDGGDGGAGSPGHPAQGGVEDLVVGELRRSGHTRVLAQLF